MRPSLTVAASNPWTRNCQKLRTTAKGNGSRSMPYIYWLFPDTDDPANLPDPGVIAAEIAKQLEATLDQFSQIACDLKR